jgi:uncharacterized protein YcfJ
MWSSERLRRPAVTLAGVLTSFVVVGPAVAAIDLAALQVSPQRGQSADQTRRDRYECHNWAIEQTGVIPIAAPHPDQSDDAQRARRAERINRILSGAALGAGIGGLIRSAQGENPYEGLIAGAAVGGVVGGATGRKQERVDVEEEADNEYLRALSACLEGRGYSVALPNPPEAEPVVASR